jgi:hypothetical protein
MTPCTYQNENTSLLDSTLRIVHSNNNNAYRLAIQELAQQMGIQIRYPYLIHDGFEIVIDAQKVQIESIGLEILHGALGFLPISVIVLCSHSSYHLRRLSH